MTSPAPRNLPPQMCPPEYLGRCAICQADCHRYGPGGNPLCPQHQALAPALQKKTAGTTAAGAPPLAMA
ncbi:hypothetical protein ACFW6S_31645 [Streptomyces sp. NPDC058740]|uniref:hypothetical protein n=1 Tax=Streptomyces sp. NPDC058740 TaxID=3346619 RepID=UPI00368935C4